MNLSQLVRFRLSETDKKLFSFEQVLKDINLNDKAIRSRFRSSAELSVLRDTPGVYLWIMRLDSREFNIYAGKTKNLPRRLTDYANKFQPHAPNDYKLRFFQSYAENMKPKPSFDLYFSKCSPGEDYTDLENSVIERYRPLINVARRDDAAMKIMEKHYEVYYMDIFDRVLA